MAYFLLNVLLDSQITLRSWQPVYYTVEVLLPNPVASFQLCLLWILQPKSANKNIFWEQTFCIGACLFPTKMVMMSSLEFYNWIWTCTWFQLHHCMETRNSTRSLWMEEATLYWVKSSSLDCLAQGCQQAFQGIHLYPIWRLRAQS